MTRKAFAPIVAVAVTFVLGALGVFAVPAALAAPADDIDSVSAPVFDPLVPRILDRPAIQLETDYYVYGPGTGFDRPDVSVTVDDRGYDEPSTLYLYWENRETGQRRYYNVASGDFVGQEVDLFGTPGSPVNVFVPSLTDFPFFGDNSAFGPLPASVPSTTGRYQFVLEVRNTDGAPVARGNAMYNNVDAVVQVNGTIGSQTWTANNAYLLATPVYVDGGTLTIEPGTMVLGSEAGQGTLIILQGSDIIADGTAMLPIIFTTEVVVGERRAGLWGGLVINGEAPTNIGIGDGEGDSGPYGGNNPADNSGILRYVRVEWAGIRFSEQNELNGIALQGVGNATVIEHIQVHRNQDDGIEFFGGTANAKYVLITDAEDDSVDWTFGWQGNLQHVVVIQRSQENDHGIEADSLEENPDLDPRSSPTIFNATFIGNRGVSGAVGDSGVLFRRGTAVNFRNFIVTNFRDNAVEVDGDSSIGLLGNLTTINNGILSGNEGVLGDPAAVQAYLDSQNAISTASPVFGDPVSLIQPNLFVSGGSPVRGSGGLVAAPPGGGFFDNVNYIGGTDPDDPWIYEGWTTFADN